jgi:hypothetical protein
MAFGSLGVYLCAIKLVLEYPQNLVLLTASVLLLGALMIGARYADIRFFRGETCDGDRATMTHFRAYTRRVAVMVAAVYFGSIILGLVFRK